MTAETSRAGKRAPRPSWRHVKIHRPYTVDEAADLTKHSKGTVRRWIKDGSLSALMDQRPFLILGVDLAEFMKARSRRGPKLAPDECYCLKCRAARRPALNMAEYLPLTETTGNLRALCAECTTIMHKAIAKASLDRLVGRLEVEVREGGKHLMDTSRASSNDHFEPERASHG